MVATKSAEGAGLIGAGLEGAGRYDELRHEGVDPSLAGERASNYGALTGLLNAIGVGKILQTGAPNKPAGALVGLGAESITEGAEQPAGGILDALAYNQPWTPKEDIAGGLNEALIAGPVGAAGGAITTPSGKKTDVDRLRDIIQDSINENQDIAGGQPPGGQPPIYSDQASDQADDIVDIYADRPGAGTMAPVQEETDITRNQKRGDRDYNIDVERKDRVTGTGKVSREEITDIKEAASRAGLKPKAVADAVRRSKSRFPTADGWAAISFK